MPADKTPGEICYEAYHRHAVVPWFTLHPHWQAEWEAAAQAVLDAADFPPLDLRLEEDTP